MTNPETFGIAELTAALGQPDHEQSAVLAWTGESTDHRWTETDVAELREMWDADTERIAKED